MGSMFKFYSSKSPSKSPSENGEEYYSPFTSKEHEIAKNIEEKIKERLQRKNEAQPVMNEIAHNHTGNIKNRLNPIYRLIEYNEELHEQIDEIIHIMNDDPERIFELIDNISRRTFLYDKGLMREKTGFKVINGRETFVSFINRNDPSVYKDIDIYNSNLMICTLFIILGIVNSFMEKSKKCEYKLLFKGGRITNKYLKDGMPELEHPSFDIDVIIFPKYRKQPKNIEGLLNLYNLNDTFLISSLIMNLIINRFEENARNISLSVLPPTGNNPLIHKLSYITKYVRSYIPLLDLAHGWRSNGVDHSKTIPYFLDHVNETEQIRLNGKLIKMDYSFQTYESLLCEKKFILLLNSTNADERIKTKTRDQITKLNKISLYHPPVSCKKFNKTKKKYIRSSNERNTKSTNERTPGQGSKTKRKKR